MIQVAPEKVRAAREAAGLTVQAAVRAAGLNYKTIEAYEGREGTKPTAPPANPTLEALIGLARAYRCTPRDFAADPFEWDALADEIRIMVTPAPDPLPTPAQVPA